MPTNVSNLTMYLRMRDQVITGSNDERDEFGVGVSFSKLKGWWDPPPTTSEVTQRQYAHGAYGNKAYYGPRDIEIAGDIYANDRISLRKGIERLAASIPAMYFEPLVVFENGLTRHVMVRQMGKPIIDWDGWLNKETGQLESTFSIQLIAVDPRRLSGDGSSPSKFPATPPGANGATLEVVNAGEGIAPPTVVKFTGCTNPRVGLSNTAKTLWLEMSIPAGQSVELDFDKKTVTMNGQDYYSALRGQFFPLNDAGNSFEFTADSVSGSGQMIIDTFDSYL